MSENSVSTRMREFCKAKFPTLESIPKDAEARNNAFREHCKTDTALNPKKHLGLFYTILEEHIKRNLGGNADDFIKRIAPKTKQTMQLKSNVTLNPKGEAAKPQQPPPQQAPPQDQQQAQTTTRPQGVMTYQQKRDLCTFPFKALITLARLRCPEIEELTQEQSDALGDAWYPLLSPYIENGKLLQWIFAGSVTVTLFGGRIKMYREYLSTKKSQKKEEEKQEPKEKPEPEKIDEQQTASLLSSEKKITAREQDDEVKRLVEKYGMDEEKVREMFKD